MEYLPDFEFNRVLILFCFLGLMLFIQFLFAVLIFGRLAFMKKTEVQGPADQEAGKKEFPPVSIVIAARNESDNLYHNLPLILNQDYPNFEVVVVNHQSIDNSYQVLYAMRMNDPKLKLIEVERSKHLGTGKKFPLSLGIKAANHELLLLTDADCRPESKDWLSLMVSRLTGSKKMVLGYAPYKKQKGFLNRLIRLDTAFIGMNYLSFARAGLPYMGVGRNLAYTKSLFESVNGFKSHYSIISGDDDLFVQDAAKKRNYTIQVDSNTFCLSDAKESWADWMRQKARHYTTSPRYQVIKKLLLGIYPLSLILAWISFVILLFDAEYRWLSLAGFGLVMILKWIIQGKCLLRLKASSFVYAFPFWDLFYAIFVPIIYYTSEKDRLGKWK
ncbi:MAG: glycosyltransferase [Bacteroidetes bacterium]|nr:MAG: glycosyltransferase [Bacteroidota bacterium]